MILKYEQASSYMTLKLEWIEATVYVEASLQDFVFSRWIVKLTKNLITTVTVYLSIWQLDAHALYIQGCVYKSVHHGMEVNQY